MIDQRKLPAVLELLECHSVEDVFQAIRQMAIRGAPAIGVAGAFGCALAAKNMKESDELLEVLEQAKEKLDKARPTAVNLAWATERMLTFAQALHVRG